MLSCFSRTQVVATYQWCLRSQLWWMLKLSLHQLLRNTNSPLLCTTATMAQENNKRQENQKTWRWRILPQRIPMNLNRPTISHPVTTIINSLMPLVKSRLISVKSQPNRTKLSSKLTTTQLPKKENKKKKTHTVVFEDINIMLLIILWNTITL